MRLYRSTNGKIHGVTKNGYLFCIRAIGKVKSTYAYSKSFRLGTSIYCVNCLLRGAFKK